MNLLAPIAKPPWTQLGKNLESLVRKAIFDFSLFEKGIERIAVALSGGKDSLSLLFLLNALRNRGFSNFAIHAIHVGGEFSCGAGIGENFLQKICDGIGAHFHSCESQQSLETLECYSCSRERRRLIFEKAQSLDIEVVAFGHHRDDSAQTLLLNLLHKAEFAANLPKVPMEAYGVTIIRPLIYVSEDRLREFSSMYQFARVTCQCPVGQNSKRKVVDQLISEMERHFPHARSNLAKAGILYGSDKALRR